MARHWLSEDEYRQVAEAVAAAEANTSGEIVTIVADRSDGYTEVALIWAALVAFAAIAVLAIWPDFYLGLADRLTGKWNAEWTPRGIIGLALFVGIAKFVGMWLIQLWQPLKFLLVPGPVKSARTRHRAIEFFKVGAERRTTGRTGILIYLSMREHRAEIVADEAIASKVEPHVWGKAMEAMLHHIKRGEVGTGMASAVAEVGKVLAAHSPRLADDRNELPDRPIEV
jgi:putative membrane protein